MKRKSEPNAILFAVGVILIIAGLAGFGPAGPYPHQDIRIGLLIWFLGTVCLTSLGLVLVWLARRKPSQHE